MRLLSITLLLAVVLFLGSNDVSGQGPSPCNNYCDACASDCLGQTDPCSQQCLDCIISSCQGTGVPISDHARYLLVGGLILVSVYSIRRRMVVEN